MTESGLVIRSKAFVDGSFIPKKYTCEGSDNSPPLAWAGVPSDAKSLMVLLDDPDAPGGRTFRHWGVYNLPADAGGLPEGFHGDHAIGDSSQAVNDFGYAAYGGPARRPAMGCTITGSGCWLCRWTRWSLLRTPPAATWNPRPQTT